MRLRDPSEFLSDFFVLFRIVVTTSLYALTKVSTLVAIALVSWLTLTVDVPVDVRLNVTPGITF
ncbi:hypothetical protein D3C73_1452460 [compost metagenome]